MKRKIFSILTVVVTFLALTLAGCGGSGGSSASPSGGGGSAPSGNVSGSAE